MTDHPYRSLPDTAFWRRAVAGRGAFVDPVSERFLTLSRDDRVVTAGSCFAQHIGRHLAEAGFGYLVTEPAHPIIPPDAARGAGYGVYSARYGNIYTTLQLRQLIERAYGRFEPAEAIWEGEDGRFVDPFRPTILPGGFASPAELEADRAYHLGRVREALETCDVFVFTLGLTEAWVSTADGAAFPLCPGVAGGRFDPARHGFRNLRAAEVSEQLTAAIHALRAVNHAVRIVLTVSPVPLAATMSGNHVLPATIYSKSVLRVAAQQAAEDIDEVHYFPSYEMVTGPQTEGRFFAEGLREVTEEGVSHVMRVFLARAAGIDIGQAGELWAPATTDEDRTVSRAREWVEAMCDESRLDPSAPLL